MALVPAQGFSQVIQIPPLDAPHADAVEQFLATLSAAEDRLIAEGEMTAKTSQRFMEEMGKRFATLSAENRLLREQLLKQQGQHREIEVLHQSEVAALKQEVASSKTAVATMRNEMHVAARKADASIAAAIAAQAHAVDATTLACDARHATTINEIQDIWSQACEKAVQEVVDESNKLLDAAMVERNQAVEEGNRLLEEAMLERNQAVEEGNRAVLETAASWRTYCATFGR